MKLVSLSELSDFLGSSNLMPTLEEANAYFRKKGKGLIPEVLWQMATHTLQTEKSEEKMSTQGNMNKLQQLASFLKKQPWMTRQELETRVKSPVSKDTFNRAQVYIGGVNDFQKKLFSKYQEAVKTLMRQGKELPRITLWDIQSVVTLSEGCRYHSVIMSSPYLLEVGAVPPVKKEKAPDVVKEKPPVIEAPSDVKISKTPAQEVLFMMNLPEGAHVEVREYPNKNKTLFVVKELTQNG